MSTRFVPNSPRTLSGAHLGDCLGWHLETISERQLCTFDSIVRYLAYMSSQDPPRKKEFDSDIYHQTPFHSHSSLTVLITKMVESIARRNGIYGADLAALIASTYRDDYHTFKKEYSESYKDCARELQSLGFNAKKWNFSDIQRLEKLGEWKVPAQNLYGGYGSQGICGLIRAIPVGLFFAQHKSNTQVIAKATITQSKVTHAHPQALSAAVAVSTAVKMLTEMQSSSTFDIIKFLDELLKATVDAENRFIYYYSIDELIHKCCRKIARLKQQHNDDESSSIGSEEREIIQRLEAAREQFTKADIKHKYGFIEYITQRMDNIDKKIPLNHQTSSSCACKIRAYVQNNTAHAYNAEMSTNELDTILQKQLSQDTRKFNKSPRSKKSPKRNKTAPSFARAPGKEDNRRANYANLTDLLTKREILVRPDKTKTTSPISKWSLPPSSNRRHRHLRSPSPRRAATPRLLISPLKRDEIPQLTYPENAGLSPVSGRLAVLPEVSSQNEEEKVSLKFVQQIFDACTTNVSGVECLEALDRVAPEWTIVPEKSRKNLKRHKQSLNKLRTGEGTAVSDDDEQDEEELVCPCVDKDDIEKASTAYAEQLLLEEKSMVVSDNERLRVRKFSVRSFRTDTASMAPCVCLDGEKSCNSLSRTEVYLPRSLVSMVDLVDMIETRAANPTSPTSSPARNRKQVVMNNSVVDFGLESPAAASPSRRSPARAPLLDEAVESICTAALTIMSAPVYVLSPRVNRGVDPRLRPSSIILAISRIIRELQGMVDVDKRRFLRRSPLFFALLVETFGNSDMACDTLACGLLSFCLVMMDVDFCSSRRRECVFMEVLSTGASFGGKSNGICMLGCSLVGAYLGTSSLPVGVYSDICEGRTEIETVASRISSLENNKP